MKVEYIREMAEEEEPSALRGPRSPEEPGGAVSVRGADPGRSLFESPAPTKGPAYGRCRRSQRREPAPEQRSEPAAKPKAAPKAPSGWQPDRTEGPEPEAVCKEGRAESSTWTRWRGMSPATCSQHRSNLQQRKKTNGQACSHTDAEEADGLPGEG
jgi:hypothetical protein